MFEMERVNDCYALACFVPSGLGVGEGCQVARENTPPYSRKVYNGSSRCWVTRYFVKAFRFIHERSDNLIAVGFSKKCRVNWNSTPKR